MRREQRVEIEMKYTVCWAFIFRTINKNWVYLLTMKLIRFREEILQNLIIITIIIVLLLIITVIIIIIDIIIILNYVL